MRKNIIPKKVISLVLAITLMFSTGIGSLIGLAVENPFSADSGITILDSKIEDKPPVSDSGNQSSSILTAIDDTTLGNWVGKYGADGYVLYAYEGTDPYTDKEKLPSYITDYRITLKGSKEVGRWSWKDGDAVSLSKGLPLNSNVEGNRRHAAAYSFEGIEIKFGITAGTGVKGIALYLADEDAGKRINKVQVFKADGITPLTTEVTLTSFQRGKYLKFNTNQSVIIKISDATFPSQNAVISGLFFGNAFTDITASEPNQQPASADPEIVPEPIEVNGVKKPVIGLNTSDGQDWKFLFADTSLARPEAKADINNYNWGENANWKTIQVPGNLVMQGYDILENRDEKTNPYKNEYYYKTILNIPNDFAGKRILLRFDAVYGGARVWVDGKYVKEHFGSFTTWDCDITNFVANKSGVEVVVGVVDRFDDPSVGSSYAHFNTVGINRDVHLIALPKTYLQRVHTVTDLDEQFVNAELQIKAGVKLEEGKSATAKFILNDASGNPIALETNEISFVKTGDASILIPIKAPKLWDAEHPNLYTLETTLEAEGTVVQKISQKVGFREITYGKNAPNTRKVYVNGKEVKLRGTCRHDVTYDRGRSTTAQEDYEEILTYKNMNMNYIRTSHYPPSKALLQACDEIGMYVEEETALAFQICNLPQLPHSAENSWLINQFKEMVERDKSHASVLIWSFGNESKWNNVGNAVKMMYDYIIETDTTRPHKFSYTENMPLSEQYRSDMWSSHYKHNGWVTNKNIPVIHDEYAHVACYNVTEQTRDLNVRNFWGENVEYLWNEIYRTEGMLGGALWGGIDDVFLIPKGTTERYQQHSDGDAAGYGEWGSVMDIYRRLKPEAWLTKKAYSPVRIENKIVQLPDGRIELEVENRFYHSNLDEVRLVWMVGEETGSFQLPAEIRPWEKGVFHLPVRSWKSSDIINLRLYTPNDIMVDEYNIHIGTPVVHFTQASNTPPTVNETENTIKVTGTDFSVSFSKLTGLITEGKLKDTVLLKGGPTLQTGGMSMGIWTKDSISYTTEGNTVIVNIAGKYGTHGVEFKLGISGNGIIKTTYKVLSAPTNPNAGLNELGLNFDINDTASQVSWLKQGLWNAYPEDHIGRLAGTALKARPGANDTPDVYGEKPEWSWKDDMSNWFLYPQNSIIQNKVTNDFNTMREHLWFYDVEYSNTNSKIRVESSGKDAARVDFSYNDKSMVDDADGRITQKGTWLTESTSSYFGTERYSQTASDSINYTFNGTGVVLYGGMQNNTGKAKITLTVPSGEIIDEKIVDTYFNGMNKKQELYKNEALSNGTYTIKLTVLGQKNNASTGNWIVFDALRILGMKDGVEKQSKLVVNNKWNYTDVYMGNIGMKKVLLQSGYTDTVTLRLTDAAPYIYSYSEPIPSVKSVTVTGETFLGSTLTANATVINGDQSNLKYQWFTRKAGSINFFIISGENKKIFTVPSDADGKEYICKVTPFVGENIGTEIESNIISIGLKYIDDNHESIIFQKDTGGQIIHDRNQLHTNGTYGDTKSYVKNGSISFTFSGTGIKWLGSKENNMGIVSVSIDNRVPIEIDLYSAQNSTTAKPSQILFEKLDLGDGEHTIKIVGGNKKNVSSSNSYLNLDAFVVVKPLKQVYTKPVTGVTINKSNITLELGKTKTLIANLTPNDATNQAVTWSTSNSDIVTVENGFITAIKVGTATITVSTVDGGFTANCVVTISPRTITGHTDTSGSGNNRTEVILELPSAYSNNNVSLSVTDVTNSQASGIAVGSQVAKAVYNIQLLQNGMPDTNVYTEGFTVKIKLPVAAAELHRLAQANKLDVYYVNGNLKTLMPTHCINENGDYFVVFTTQHFSTYAILERIDKVTTHSSNTTSKDQSYEAWQRVMERIEDAAEGDIITARIQPDATIPAKVIDLIAGKYVTLVIDNGKDEMKLNGSTLNKTDMSRVYFTFEELAKLKETEKLPSGSSVNPETGGGVIVEIPATSPTVNAPATVTEQSAISPKAEPKEQEQQQTAPSVQEKGSANTIVWSIAILLVASGGLLAVYFFKARKSNKSTAD